MKSESGCRSRYQTHAYSHSPKKRVHEEIQIGDDDSDIEILQHKQPKRPRDNDNGPTLKEKLVDFLLWMKDKSMFQSFISSALKSFGYIEENIEVYEMSGRSGSQIQSQGVYGSLYEKPDHFLTIGSGRLNKVRVCNIDSTSTKRPFKKNFQLTPLVHSTPFARVSHRRPLHELSSSSTHKLCNFCNTTSSGSHKCPEREAAEKKDRNSNIAKLLANSEVYTKKGRVSLGKNSDSPDIEFITEMPPSEILCSRTKLTYPLSKSSRRRNGEACSQASKKDAKIFTTNEVVNEREKEAYKLLLESYFIDGCWEPQQPEASFRNAHTQADLDCEVLEIQSKKDDVTKYIEKYHKKQTFVPLSEVPKNKTTTRRSIFKPEPKPEEVLLLDDDTPFVFKEEPRKLISVPIATTSTPYFSAEWLAELKKSVEREKNDRSKILEEQNKQIAIVKERIRQKVALASQEAQVPKEEEFPELTPEMEQVIRDALNVSSSNHVLVQHKQCQILKKDMETLANQNWLNDEIINVYFTLIMERSNQSGYPLAYAFNSFFYCSLKTKGYNSVRRWTRKIDIFSYEILLVPLHLGCHWCLAVIDFRDKSMKYYDSMSGKENCLDYLSKYIMEEANDKKSTVYDLSNWTFELVEDIPQQMNGNDCGMFALKYAEYLTRDVPITFTQENMQYFRQKMIYEIMTQKIS